MEDSISDSVRENAVAIITPEFVPKFKVHVEGKLDYVIVKTMFPSLTVQQIGCKDEVILRTNNQEHSIGIVDTDSDFNHSQISDLDRCTDTGQYCCMFAAISGIFSMNKIFFKLRNMVNKKFLENRKKGIEDISKHNNKISLVMKKKTESRLFRSHVYLTESRSIELHDYNLTWDLLKSKFKKISDGEISDIGKHEKNNFDKFISDFKKKLANCGINDHIYEAVIISLISDEYAEDTAVSSSLLSYTMGKFFRQNIEENKDEIRNRLALIHNFISKNIPN